LCKFLTLLGFESSLLVWLEVEKHLIPFRKLTFRMTLIFLLLDVILSHYQIVFEITENDHAYGKIVVNLLNLGDTRHVWEK
jgi:hypothetical protein